MEENKKPVVFISYSWSSEHHKERVIKLARELVEKGIDVKIDEWDIKPGQSLHKFMEEMVNNPEITKVLVICDKKYTEKANKRKDGVGIETDIITPEVYTNSGNTKFIPIIFEKDVEGKAYVPTYFKGRQYLDLTEANDNYSEEFENLIRVIIDKPKHVKPKLGKIPAYILEEDKRGQTSASARAVIHAIENERKSYPKWKEYTTIFIDNFENFIVKNKEGALLEEEKEVFLKNLDSFLPYRDEFLEILAKSIQYGIEQLPSILHGFFEKALQYQIERKNEVNLENINFFIYELLLYSIAILIKEERFDIVAEMLNRNYVIESTHNGYYNKTFKEFHMSDGKLFQELAKQPNGDKYFSYVIKRIMENTNKEIVRQYDLIDADLLMRLKSLIEDEIYKKSLWWYPYTFIYADEYQKSPLFLKCISKNYLKKLNPIFRETFLEDIKKLSKESFHFAPSGRFPTSFYGYIDLDKIGTEE